MDREELEEILVAHERWLNEDDTGRQADLQGACLVHMDLHGLWFEALDLQGARFDYSDLRGTGFHDCDLQRAKFIGADLRGSDFMGCNLTGVSFRDADLRGANFDQSAWPLDCGTVNVRVDDRIMAQLLNHVLALDHPLARELRAMKTVTRLSDMHADSKKMWDQ